MMLQNTYSITTCRQQHVNLVSEGPINPCAAAASALPNAVRSPITSSKSASLVDPSPFRNHLTHAFTHYTHKTREQLHFTRNSHSHSHSHNDDNSPSREAGFLHSQSRPCRSLKASSRLRHRRRRPQTPITPPHRAPKRKHDDSAEQTSAQNPDTPLAEDQPTPKASKTFHNVEAAALPATPLSSEGKMDSDIEDFNSVASSDAFDDDVGSSIGGGKCFLEVRWAGGVED